eukprot:c21522_g2_i3.p1 GENE.c21522_g2_i3~~c21522_g2_i3.p1  ORF type:complete len:381 (-),score=53.86 c21522_g2_i3:33-1175(-)
MNLKLKTTIVIQLVFVFVYCKEIMMFGKSFQTIELIKLEIPSAALEEAIPEEIGKFVFLRHIRLDFNRIVGTIPSEIGNLHLLRSLRLDSNRLEGTIPSQIGTLTEIIYLFLSNNLLSGTIPTQIGLLAMLTELKLANNQISGTIPGSFLSVQNKVEVLNFAKNLLTGSIPSELFAIHPLKIINIQDNQLSGAIPSQIGELARGSIIDFSNNQLYGEIPKEISFLNYDIHLNVNKNLQLSLDNEDSNVCNRLKSCLETSIMIEDCDCADPQKNVKKNPTPTVVARKVVTPAVVVDPVVLSTDLNQKIALSSSDIFHKNVQQILEKNVERSNLGWTTAFSFFVGFIFLGSLLILFFVQFKPLQRKQRDSLDERATLLSARF